MRKSLLARIPLLTAFVLVPSCVEGSDEPSESEPQAIDTEGEAMAGDEATGSDEIGAAKAAPTGTSSAASDCDENKLCLWRLPDFAGERLELKPSLAAGCRGLGPYDFGNATSSWRNRSDRGWRLYTQAYCKGDRFIAPSGERAAGMSDYWDNNIQSVCYGPDCP